jgi:hypothetical protein
MTSMVSETAIIIVTVNDIPWTRLPSLANSGSEAAVFAVDAETGAVVFGDGLNGQAPPVGSTIVVTYRYGLGSTGSISMRIEQESDWTKFWLSIGTNCRAGGWGITSDPTFLINA